MTRQLILVRHAKAADDGPSDLERPLAPRGRRDSAAIGRSLAQSGIAADRVVVSPALRARHTWDAAQAELGDEVDTVIDDRVYDNTVAALLDVIHDTPDSVHALVVVGHNPSIGELAGALADSEGDSDARRELAAGYPTSAVAVFDLPGGWAEVHPHSATLSSFETPRGDE
jgi:phosphohistidine phosphatase